MTANNTAQVDEEKDEEVPDGDALERKRLREAEEWRLKQLRAGVSSEDNSNFQVCMMMFMLFVTDICTADQDFPATQRRGCWSLISSCGQVEAVESCDLVDRD